MEKWRIIDLDAIDLPLLHGIEEAIAKEKLNNTLLLWRVNKPSLTLGYFQNAYQEVDVAAAKELKVQIVRRMGGGGTGYLTPAVLAYSIIADEMSKSIPKEIEKSYEVICNGVTLGLKELGLDATFAPINDILIGGKKFSGSSQHRSYGWIIQHGFISTDLDLQTLARLIKAPKEKLQGKGAVSHEDRITWINKELEKSGRTKLSLNEIKRALRSGFEKALGVSFHDGKLAAIELEIAGDFKQEFEKDTWNLKPRLFHRANALSIHKARKGVIRVNAYIAKGKIREILITGDYIIHPVEAIADLEAKLQNVETNAKQVRKAVNEFYEEKKAITPGASPEDFVMATMKAIENCSRSKSQT
jgi:lipoate-protein ligase A